MADLLESLNPVQREAASAPLAPLLILAGAGSGKTRVLTARMLWLMAAKDVQPESIVGLTFTNKAAEELRGRLAASAPGGGRGLVLHTFHALGARILRRWGAQEGIPPSFTILDDDDALGVVRDVMRSAGSTGVLSAAEVRRAISLAKAEGLDDTAFAARAEGHAREEVVAPLYSRYERSLRASGALDFDDLILWPERLLTRNPSVASAVRGLWQHILVDEYQDTSPAQYRLLRALVGPGRSVTCVGDPDQSIYGWRGADIRNILEFERDFPDALVVTMEQNYRSTARILEAASSVIRHNERRVPKRLWTSAEGGRPLAWMLAADEGEEAAWVVEAAAREIASGAAAGDVAVLYRTHAQSRPLEEALVRGGLPYALIGGVKFYARREVKDLLSWLRILVNPADGVGLSRALSSPPRGIGDATLDRLSAAAGGGPLLEALGDRELMSGMPGRARTAAREFLALLETASSVLAERGFTAALALILGESGYLPWTARREPAEAPEREENLKELLAAARSAEDGGATAGGFLENAALMADIDRLSAVPDRITLMTLHNAKGLEFPHVFICGMEENLLPHASSLEDPAELEEERRLFYVGLTRARTSVVLSAARGRRRHDRFAWGIVSRFIHEIPASAMTPVDTPGALPLGADGSPRRPPAAAQEPPAPPGELVRVAEDAADIPELRPGEEVRHPRFGTGRVLRVEGSGPDARIRVSFPRAGTKDLLARLSRLVRTEDWA